MVWGDISLDSQTSLVVIRSTFTAQLYVDEILAPVLLSYLSQNPGLIFQQDNARPHATRSSINCLQACRTFPCPARSLSYRVCLEYDAKAIASTRKWWWLSSTFGAYSARNISGDHPDALSSYTNHALWYPSSLLEVSPHLICYFVQN